MGLEAAKIGTDLVGMGVKAQKDAPYLRSPGDHGGSETSLPGQHGLHQHGRTSTQIVMLPGRSRRQLVSKVKANTEVLKAETKANNFFNKVRRGDRWKDVRGCDAILKF